MRGRPRLDRAPLELPPLAGPLEAVWGGICALADALGDLPWTVVGGQMVFLHAAEAGVDMHRVSTDIDAAVDVRTELVPVRSDGTVHWVPRPNLLGAIVGKAAGAAADTADPERHLVDLAFLCGLIPDPFALAEQVDKKDRSRLKKAAAKLSADHPAWRAARSPTDAQSALDILIGG